MHEKIQFGDRSIIKPNKNVIEMTKTILAQNEKILKMNSRLIDMFSSPALMISGDIKKQKDSMANSPYSQNNGTIITPI